MGLTNTAKAGVAAFLGGVQFSIFFIISEIQYSQAPGGYSVSANAISDLGANCPSGGGPCYIPPSAYTFDTSIVIYGLFGLAVAYYVQRAFRWKPATAMLILASIGAIGVGLFPETTGIVHSIFSLVVFLFTGLSAIVTARFLKKPLFYFAIIMGLTTVVLLVLFVGSENLGLGGGGMERMIAYPAILWTIGFGAHLMGTEDKTSI